MKMTPRQAREWGLLDPAKASRRKPRPRDRKPARDALFDALCKEHGLPVPVQEFEFAKEIGRNWRFDYLFEGWLAVEKVGGVWTRGHHSRGQSQIDDFEKFNHAVLLDYYVLFFTPEQFESGEAFAMIRLVLQSREGHA